MDHNVFVIAEAGVNHNGDPDIAFKLVDAAANAGADAVKFQTFIADNLASQTAPKAAYQNATTDPIESQHQMLQKLELDHVLHFELKAYATSQGLQFLSTPFDIESLNFLVGDLGLTTVKVASGEITNGPLLLAIGAAGVQTFLSTGMANMQEIEEALAVLAFGFITPSATPSNKAFRDAFNSKEGRAALSDHVGVLHCTTEYPAPVHDVNLNAMIAIRDRFGLPVGYSDHTIGTEISTAAVALGAKVIEKHFTLDRNLTGPDHRASLEPDELKTLVKNIRNVCSALGHSKKATTNSERKNLPIARKSLIASAPIEAGEAFTTANLTAKRPGNGRSPMEYWNVLGTSAVRKYDCDELI